MIVAFAPARYSPLYLAVPHTEAEVQRDVLDALRTLGVLAWPVDVGARAVRSGRTTGKARAAGPKGLPDVMGLTKNGRLVAVEVKRPEQLSARGKVIRAAGIPSDEQVRWLLSLRERGALTCVAWGVDDVLDMLKGA